MASMIFPPISGNFLQIPQSFVDALVHMNLSRNELLVLLHLSRGTFSLYQREPMATVESISMATDLEAGAVQEALSRAVERGIVLKFEVVGSPDVDATYAIHTHEAHLLAYYEREDPTTGPFAVPSQAPVEAPPVAAAASVALPVDRSEQTITRPVSAAILARVVTLLGRELTKDERNRMDALGAAEADIAEAIEKLQARKVQVYSSDQIIYEYESLQLQKRQQASDARKTTPRINAICPQCNGTGYLFVGKSSLRICDCKKK